MGTISTGIADHIQLGAGDLAIFDGHLVVHDLRVAAARAGKFLLAGVLHTYWPASGQGQVGTQVFQQHFLFIAKTAADARFNDAYLLDWKSDERGHHAAHVERHLGAGTDHQAVIFIPPGNTHMRFQMGMLLSLGAVLGRIYVVCLGKGFLNITTLGFNMLHNIVGAVIDAHGIRFVVDDGGTVLYGVFRVHHHR
ncbi:hypothetical protein SDC9_172789 [bioreactor metagenome]|uniref:Uncharacterized protein n=1 Tax=bioreactor metagenome TaxID=1076179 RepID=A0A645GGV6_9ZZZZ